MPQPPLKKIKEFPLDSINLSQEEYEHLQKLASDHVGNAWDRFSNQSPLTDEDKKLVAKFSDNLKSYLYYTAQNPYCCYCGEQLRENKSEYHLDHIIAKNGRTKAVFHLRNLALSCSTCNSHKADKSVTNSDPDPDEIYLESKMYKISHPHFDIWSKNLRRDKYGRILGTNIKGTETIALCKLHLLSAMRLADYFEWVGKKEKKYWAKLYNSIYSGSRTHRSRKQFFLKTLANTGADPLAEKILNLLSRETQIALDDDGN